ILTWDRLLLSVLAVLPIAAAMPAGAWLARTLNPQTFDRVVLVFLAGMAAKLIYDSGLFD
ncbi:MAG: sulfite exporter TauE/SafE family protein, partial [Alphaproteobacteria bacterium]|nr:sulfite exporter TauE/SafE family protein [Alphaproteobacteria bacterium]